MGFSLRDIRKKIDAIGAQVNPFDNGATYNTSIQNRRPVPNQGSFVSNATAPVTGLVRGLAGGVYHTAGIPVEGARLGLANLTHNNQVANSARQRFQLDATTARQLAQATPRFVYGLGESLNPAGGDVYQRSHTANSPTENFLLGKEPIPSWQKTFKETAATKGRTTAQAEAVLNSLMTAGGLRGGAMVSLKAGRAVKTFDQAQNQIGAIGKNVGGQPLKHFTSPEVAKQLQGGAAFDFSKNPIHGTGNLARGETTGKFVNDGKPALYLSKNDKVWSVANIPKANPEVVNIDHVTPKMMKEGYFQKNGITPVMDYKQQKYVGYKNAFDTKQLQGVDYHISPNARKLTIDSASKLKDVANSLGVHPDDPQFWTALRNKYDVVDITNVAKNRATEGSGRKFFQAAKADQSIVLNPDVASTTVPRPTVRVKQNPPTPNIPLRGAVGKNVNKPNVPEVQAKPKFASIDEAFKEMDSPKAGKQGVMLSKPEIQQVNDLFANHPDPINQQFRGKVYGRFHNARDVILGHANGNTVVAELDNHGVPTGRIRSHATPLDPKQIQGDFNPSVTQPPQVGKTHLPKVSLKTPPTPVRGVVKAKGQGDMTTPPDFLQTSPGYVPKTPEELAGLSPKVQMTLAKLQGMGPPSKEQIATGMKSNPYKSNIHEVAPGNWVGARTAGDAVSAPLMTAGKIADYHLGKLAKDSPSLHGKFWDAVEKGVIPKDAPPSFQAATKWFRETANGIHKESNILGTPTRYQKNWELRAASLKDVTPEQLGSGELGSVAKHAIQRKYATHAEFVAAAEKAGLSVEKNPRVALQKYVTATTSALERKSLAKSLAEADRNNPLKPHTVDLGWGTTVRLSDEGLHQARGILSMTTKKTKLGTFYDASNSFRKGLLLSLSQFHTVNIAGLRAAPALVMPKPGYLAHGDLTMGVHPVRAARGLGNTIRPLFPGGKGFVNRKLEEAYARGDVQFAARHGSPIGKSAYGASKHFNVGHKMVFEKQIPMMHKEVIGALRRDMEKFGIKEGSPEALEAGKVANFTMGFINKAAMNMHPTLVKGIERVMLAGQFTPSKLANLYKGATKVGLAGSMARADVAANAISATALIVGVGWLVRQKSDDVRDMVLRALINPAIPTNIKDNKDNTQEIRIPMTYTAEVAHILGIKLVRQADGHLGVNFSPKNMPDTVGEWARARLSPNLGDVVKVSTNTEFGNKPLYEEGAQHGKQAIQVATKAIQGALPIGLQGLGYTDAVKNRLPGSSREVLEAGTPSSNPLVKSLASSTGFTIRTDKTVGKSLDTNRYFSSIDEAGRGLNAQESAALKLYTGSKKNSVTGKYAVMPSVNDQRAKASALLQNPKVIDRLIGMNQNLAEQGSKVDPLWQQTKDQITGYFQYQAMPPGGADRSHWHTQNDSWYQPLTKDRSKFFDSLPPGDPNKPQAPIEFPSASPQVSNKMDTYFAIKDDIKAAEYVGANPDLQQQFDKQAEYNNAMRKAQGYGELDTYPKSPPAIQKLMDVYNAQPKNDGPRGGNKTRSIWIQSHPKEWAMMTRTWTQASLYNLEKDAGQAQFKDSGFSQKGLKAIYNLGQYDVGKYTDKNGNEFYALGGGGSGGGYGRRSGSSSPPTGRISLTKGSVHAPKVSVKGVGKLRSTLAKTKATKPKVSIKKSLV